MPANIREMLIGFGFRQQPDLATANVLAEIWRLGKLNTSFTGPKLNTENDAAELGKGHEWATQVFKTSWDVAGQIEKYLSSDFAAWVMAFSLGKVTPTGGGGNWIYTVEPLDPVTDGIELPCFSYIEQIRAGALTTVIDRMALGCVIEGWSLTVGSGPGRANSKLVADIVGCGLHQEPSGIVLPAAVTEKLLPAASLACTINGVNYVSKKNFVNLTATWKNNHRLDSGFYPGSGVQGAQAQVDKILLSGDSGTANVTTAGGLTKLATYGVSLTATAAAFVVSWAADYAAVGITVTSEGPYLIFTAAVPGTAFASPAIVNVAPNLTGTVENWQGNVASGASGAVRGRMEVGDRELGLQYTARYAYGSFELARLKDQKEGTAVISLTYDANNSLQLTYQRLAFSVVELGETEGIVTVQVTATPLMHSVNGLLEAVAKCNTENICG